MSERAVRIMTGLIALTLFGSLTVFGVYLGAGKLSPKYHLHAKFTSAGQGLENGSDVKIHGINVGQVTTVHLVNGEAQVNMALHDGEKVPVKVVECGDHMTTLTKPEFGAALIAFLRSGKSE